MKIFIIGSYTGKSKEEIQSNIKKAQDAAKVIIEKAHLPLIPQSMYAFMEDEMQMDKIMESCFEWIKECDAVLILNTGSKNSGTKKAFDLAKLNNKIIFESTGEIPEIKKYSEEELKQILDEAKSKVKVGGIYMHYKNPEYKYKVVDIVLSETSQVPVVIYEALYWESRARFARTLSSFMARVMVEGEEVRRFRLEGLNY